MKAYLLAVVDVLAALAPFLLLGAIVAGLLHVLLPPDFVRRHLGAKGGVLKAVLLGVPLPLCSCGVIPAGLGLKKDGASDGATVGFLISTPQTGVDSILVSASFLGLPFALFKVASAAVTGLVGGWITGWVSPSDTAVAAPVAAAKPHENKLREFFEHALMILGSIWGWVVFGVLVSAAIEVFVPDDFFAGLATHGVLLPMLVVLAISLPLYVCATASVPIAAALVASGMPAGAALVFLMAGPATNVATIGAIYRTLGKKSLFVYLATIIVGSIGLGLVFDFVLPVDAHVGHHDHGAMAWWTILSMIVLVGLLAHFALRDILRFLRKRPEPAPAAAPEVTGPVTIGVQGMTCKGCVARLERTLKGKEGVEHVDVSLTPGRAVVYGKIDLTRVREAVAEAGFEPLEAPADPATP